MLPLEIMKSGAWAEVAAIYGEPTWVRRLTELGIQNGIRLRILQGGSPCLLQIGENRMSIRGGAIYVHLVDG
jgi:ferrous iron transport protein A